jgi:glycosidase
LFCAFFILTDFQFAMQKIAFLLPFLLLLRILPAQVSCLPVFPSQNEQITIFYDASQGNAALAGVTPVYAHMGVVTNLSSSPTNWRYVVTDWNVENSINSMEYVSPNVWKKTINIQQFFAIPAGETVLRLAFVFRNAAGNVVGRAADGSDMFYNVYPENLPLQTLLLQPTAPAFLTEIGDNIPVRAAASEPATLRLLDNGTEIASGSGELLEHTISVSTGGQHQVLFIASTAGGADTSAFTYVIPADLPAQDPPAGTENGISYLDNSTVRLSLYAPNKSTVYVLGDFNDWLPNPAHQMRRSTDGNTWWLDISGLTPAQSVRFQYLVDGDLRIADPLSTLVLDPWNDPFISAETYPSLPAYPTGKTTGIVSMLQTAQTPFDWQADNYQRPSKQNLVVYELLLRDFVAAHDYQTLLDSLDYLQRLGVTAIELMPINEFDNNVSWGYSPSYHKALDKYYGTAEAFKTFVDACHQRGMAVIVDAVFNHVTGASPLAQLYWDAANNRPAADNPWLNPIAKHEFNVFNDFNHQSLPTQTYMKNCLKYWIEEFKIDGFRFDLSKGFTQNNTLGSVSAWGQYDASRVALWKDYADFIWDIDPENYVILEHFAANNEEKELAEYGMMLWGNMWGAYKDVALGYASGVNAALNGIAHTSRGWAVPHLVGYMESHDEDRIAFECKTYGNSVAGYNIKTLPIGMRRIELVSNLLYTVPGPKMLWQFGEFGYDFPINYCENGSVNPDCRTAPKPIRWDYLNDPYRRRLHDVVAALLQLRQQYDAFQTNNFQLALGSGQVRTITLNGATKRAFVIANVGTTATTANAVFPPSPAGGQPWYEYYTGDTIVAPDFGALPLPLQPGEYRIYLEEVVPLPAGLNPTPVREVAGTLSDLQLWPNPFESRLRLNFTLESRGDVRFELRDVQGRLVAEQLFEGLSAGEQLLEIEAPGLETGLYFVSLSDAQGARLSRRVIKHF